MAPVVSHPSSDQVTVKRYTLIADGPSDRRLTHVIDWCLSIHTLTPYTSQFADFRGLPTPPASIKDKILFAHSLFPSDLIFIHRDIEALGSEQARIDEIHSGYIDAKIELPAICPYIPITPALMQEAWFLFNEPAIKQASGNPSCRKRLNLPNKNKVEKIHAKDCLRKMLVDASELEGRHLQRFNVAQAIYRLSELIQDFSPLRGLTQFDKFEANLKQAVEAS